MWLLYNILDRIRSKIKDSYEQIEKETNEQEKAQIEAETNRRVTRFLNLVRRLDTQIPDIEKALEKDMSSAALTLSDIGWPFAKWTIHIIWY